MALVREVRGSRIHLAGLDPEKISSQYLSWMKDPEVLRFLDDPYGEYSLESLRGYVCRMNESLSDYLFGIFLNDSSEHIGNIKIGGVNSLHRRGDIGLIIGAKRLWGFGFGTEAITLVTGHAFDVLNLNKVYAGILEANIGSFKAFMNSGFREVGRFQRHCFCDGIFVNSIIVEKCASYGPSRL